MSYGFDNLVRRGSNLIPSSNQAVAWDHSDLPGCASASTHWTPFPAQAQELELRHNPPRHLGTTNVLFLAGNVSSTVTSH